jgi:hypothetical protein
MAGFLSPIGMGQWFTDQGVVLAGGKINTYIAGTTTPAATYTTSSLSVPNSNPIVLDPAGRAPQEIWLQQGQQYKFIVTDANGNTLSNGTFDNVSGINDTSGASQGEWVISGSTPTYVSGTQFTVPGNQTTTFSVNRRVSASVSAGTVYGTITASSFSSPNTTVTVAWDAGSLDSGLTSVSYSILNPTNPSYLSLLNVQVFTSSGTYTPTPGATKAIIEAVGAGGAGGGCTAANTFTSGGSGGSAGVYGKFLIPSGLQGYAGTTVTVSGPAAGVSGGNGNSGGNTQFGSYFTLGGGPGGLASNGLGAVPPASMPTTFSSTLTTLASSWGEAGGFGITGSSFTIGGQGGSSPLGAGGQADYWSQGSGNVGGHVGAGYGSGGGGAVNYNGTNAMVAKAGASSAGGIVIIYEFL